MNLCPECAQGKPRNCIGWTLNEADEEVPCDSHLPLSPHLPSPDPDPEQRFG